MKLIEEIIEMLSSESPNLNNALFKTKVLLHKLGEKDLIAWVDAELNGYKDTEELPDYRILKVSVLGNFSNMAYRYTEQPLPLLHLDEKLRKSLETTHLRQSFAVIESYAKDDTNLTITIPPELYRTLSKGLDPSYSVDRAWGKHQAGSMLQVVNEIRSRLLDFVLQLSEKIPNEIEPGKMKEKSKEVGTTELFNNAVFGNNATVIVGDSNIQNIRNSIKINNFDALSDEFRKHSMPEEDIASLKVAIERDKNAPELTEKKFGANIRQWMGKMLTKATDAIWNINLGVAGNLLTEALKAYYGWS